MHIVAWPLVFVSTLGMCVYQHCIWVKWKCHTVWTVPKSKLKIGVAKTILLPLTQIDITVHSPGLVQALQ